MQAESKESNPHQWVKKWIAEEENSPLFGVLATVDHEYKPYTRTIAIREINERGALFFTQKGSKKIDHIKCNPATSLTLYLPSYKRQITFRGRIEALSNKENLQYWNTYPKESQVRFLVYGPRSGQRISSNKDLDKELEMVRKHYQNRLPDKPESYVGYRICPDAFEFYQLNNDRLSDAFIVNTNNGEWEIQRIIP